MKTVYNCHMKRALAVAVAAAFASFSVQAGEPAGVDKYVLAQVMALHDLDEQGAVHRLLAEEMASDAYQRIRSMELPGYAGAWFDADSGKLHVAVNDLANKQILMRHGAVPVEVVWSLDELRALQESLAKDDVLAGGEVLRSLYIDYKRNRVMVGVVPSRTQIVRESLSRYGNALEVYSDEGLLELSTSIRGADGTRNYTFEQYDYGSGYYPCSIGAAVENGYYTAGHCGEKDDNIRWAANYAYLGGVGASAYPSSLAALGDIAWVDTAPGWVPTAKVNGYGSGVINVPAKWSGINEVPVGATVCRYGQTSGGPHCGVVNLKGGSFYFDVVGSISNVTRVLGACTSPGDSGGTWLAPSGGQLQGTNIGGGGGSLCSGSSSSNVLLGDEVVNSGPIYTFFQPISDHISAYKNTAGSLLTSHGAAAPAVFGLLCPDMGSSGMGTFVCSFSHYNSQGHTEVEWEGVGPTVLSGMSVQGVCASPGGGSGSGTVAVKLTVKNPYGSTVRTRSFACPMGPIP